MTDELREVVARAIYEAREGPVANADFARQLRLWNECLGLADAALAAIMAAGYAVVKLTDEHGEGAKG